MNVLSLFDGISCGMQSLKNQGKKVDNYFSSEIDKNAIMVSKNNHNNIQYIGDVVNVGQNLPNIDLLFAGSPCQGFSRAGLQKGFTDHRSKLFFEFLRILELKKPKYFLLENTCMSKKDSEMINNYLGVEFIKINSSLLSAQNRERLYWTNIPNVKMPSDKNILLESIVGKYDGIYVVPRGTNKGGIKKYNNKSPCITTSSWNYNFFIQLDKENRRQFTPEECEQLQTLPIGYTLVVAKTNRYKLLGNCWTVDVISHILKDI